MRKVADHAHDRWHGVHTGGVRATGVEDGHRCATLSYRDIRAILRSAGLTADDTVLDLGCGSGRVLICAAALGAARAIGVEADAQIAAAARQMTARARRVGGVMDVVQAPAQEYPYSDETIVYLFNPFGRETLAAVLRAMEARGWPAPGRRLVYINPEWAEVLRAAPWLEMRSEREIGEHAVQVWAACEP